LASISAVTPAERQLALFGFDPRLPTLSAAAEISSVFLHTGDTGTSDQKY
jgi:hypothetical protein